MLTSTSTSPQLCLSPQVGAGVYLSKALLRWCTQAHTPLSSFLVRGVTVRGLRSPHFSAWSPPCNFTPHRTCTPPLSATRSPTIGLRIAARLPALKAPVPPAPRAQRPRCPQSTSPARKQRRQLLRPRLRRPAPELPPQPRRTNAISRSGAGGNARRTLRDARNADLSASRRNFHQGLPIGGSFTTVAPRLSVQPGSPAPGSCMLMVLWC